MKFAMFFAAALLGGNAIAAAMPPEAKALGCVSCHDIDAQVVGPAWQEVSRRYRNATQFAQGGKSYGLEDGLVMKISQGGRGNWGSLPMPPQDLAGGHEREIRGLVKFILQLDKSPRPPN